MILTCMLSFEAGGALSDLDDLLTFKHLINMKLLIALCPAFSSEGLKSLTALK